VTSMGNARERLKAVLKPAEGTGPIQRGRMMPYLDCCGRSWRLCQCAQKGNLTIGWGRNLDANGISFAEGEAFLENDVDNAIKDLVAARVRGFEDLDPVRQATLVECCFNLGIARFLEFRKMLAAVAAQDFGAAARELLDSAAARQLPIRYGRLAQTTRNGERGRDPLRLDSTCCRSRS
jgi:lysozyme